MAYRQFVSWIRRGQPMGRKFRIVLPACVVNRIRQTFPETRAPMKATIVDPVLTQNPTRFTTYCCYHANKHIK